MSTSVLVRKSPALPRLTFPKRSSSETTSFLPTLIRWTLAVHLVLSPLLFWPGAAETFELHKVALLTATSLVVGALGIMGWLRTPSLKRIVLTLCEDWIALGMILCVLSAALSTMLSVSPVISWRGDHGSWFGLRTVLAFVVLFFATRSVCKTVGDAVPLFAATAVATLLASVYGLVQVAGRDPVSWVIPPYYHGQFRPFSTLGHPNTFGAYLAMALALTAELARRALRVCPESRGARFQRARSRLVGTLKTCPTSLTGQTISVWRWFVGALLVVVGLTAAALLALTLSRAAWLAAGCMMVVLTLAWRCAGNRRASLLLLAVLLAGVGCLPLVGLQRVRDFFNDEGRWSIWSTTWQLFLDRPICGWGTDAFRLAFGTHRLPQFWHTESSGTPARAHSDLLNLLATQGIVGAIAGLVLVAGLVRAGVRCWRKEALPHRATVGAVIAALVAFFVQGLFGFTVAGTGVLFVTLAALLSRWSCARTQAPPLPSTMPWFYWPARLAVGVAAVVALWMGVVQPLEAHRQRTEGDCYFEADPATALRCYEQAVALDPMDDRTWLQLAGAVQLVARKAASPADWDAAAARANEALDRTVALVPVDPFHRASRARWRSECAFAGKAPAQPALEEWQAALALDPDNAMLLTEAARHAVALGERPYGRHWLGHALDLYPDYAPVYLQLGMLALAEGKWEDAHSYLTCSLGKDWRDEASELQRAHAALATACMGLHHYQEARDHAVEAAKLAPDWSTPAFLEAQALEKLGDRASAIKCYEHVLQLDPNHAAATFALQCMQAPLPAFP